MSRRKIIERLDRAQSEQSLVRIERSPKHADYYDSGFVLGYSRKWVLIRAVTDAGFDDGLHAMRMKDVVKVRSNTHFAETFARTQEFWPPTMPQGVDLSSTKALLTSISSDNALVGIEREHKIAALWIGLLKEIAGKYAVLLEVRPDASWHDEPLGYKLKTITKIQVGSQYLTALSQVTGRDKPKQAD